MRAEENMITSGMYEQFADIIKIDGNEYIKSDIKWTLCSEQQPLHTGWYLVTYTRKICRNEVAVAFFSREDYEAHDPNPWEITTYADCEEIIAWQPCPSPYGTE